MVVPCRYDILLIELTVSELITALLDEKLLSTFIWGVFIPWTIDSEFMVVILLNCKPIVHSFESITVIGELIVIVLLSYGHGRIVLIHNVLLFKWKWEYSIASSCVS